MAPPPVAPGLEELVTAVRAAVDGHDDSRRTADLVAGELRRHLPSPDILPVAQRIGDPVSRVGSSVRRYYDLPVLPASGERA